MTCWQVAEAGHGGARCMVAITPVDATMRWPIRRGIGRFLLEAGEGAARAEGFKTMEMGSTAAGRPLYEACGYRFIEDLSQPSEDGTVVPVLRLRKTLI